jgi:hypothetical protein
MDLGRAGLRVCTKGQQGGKSRAKDLRGFQEWWVKVGTESRCDVGEPQVPGCDV